MDAHNHVKVQIYWPLLMQICFQANLQWYKILCRRDPNNKIEELFSCLFLYYLANFQREFSHIVFVLLDIEGYVYLLIVDFNTKKIVLTGTPSSQSPLPMGS